jgi:glutathione S-transferase
MQLHGNGVVIVPKHLRLISHELCPYVQRAVIVAREKGIAFERVDIDLAAKPDWFLKLSPTGKVPVLEVTEADGSVHVLFESAVIAEYLDEIGGFRLLPVEPLQRARQRAWVEFASTVLADIARLYSAPGTGSFDDARISLEARLEVLEQVIAGPWFAGDQFGLADAAFAPAFRYLDVFDWRIGHELVHRPAKVRAWAEALARRPSVRAAVADDYAERLIAFVAGKHSHLAGELERHALELA